MSCGEERKVKVAICYDFDKTLSPDDMQAQGFIQDTGCDVKAFWSESNELATQNDMDQNLAYMYLMMKKSQGQILFTRKALTDYGKRVALFPGVDTWFDRINSYGETKGVVVEHYIISSGLKEMIEGTVVADKFKQIYASSFYYNENDVPIWPAQAVNYTNKTQFLFRISKGVLDINDPSVNEHVEDDKYAVPFRNIVYIGDSVTDIPCMKLVNMNGGHSIGVYNGDTQDKAKVFKMIKEKRIKYFTAADYTEGSELEQLVCSIIDRTVTNEKLEAVYNACLAEQNAVMAAYSKDEEDKEYLISSLQDSRNFYSTHKLIAKMNEFESWTEKQQCKLIDIALTNRQVKYILGDADVQRFYFNILEGRVDESAEQVRKLIQSSGK